MSYSDKVAENKRVAEKCLDLKAYNAGVSRAYYAAFLHIKNYLESSKFDYGRFLQQHKPGDRAFSHGTIQPAIVKCLMDKGKKNVDVYKLMVLGNMYDKRRIADYQIHGTQEIDLKDSLQDLNTVLSVVV